MLIAGTVNLCILLLAAANLAGVDGTDTLEGAYAALQSGIGPVVATLFAVGLLASGLASTSVGAYAGAEIMHGLLRVRIPLIARRLVTLIPALAILAIGRRPHPRARAEPGRAVVRHPVRAHPARGAHRAARARSGSSATAC